MIIATSRRISLPSDNTTTTDIIIDKAILSEYLHQLFPPDFTRDFVQEILMEFPFQQIIARQFRIDQSIDVVSQTDFRQKYEQYTTNYARRITSRINSKCRRIFVVVVGRCC